MTNYLMKKYLFILVLSLCFSAGYAAEYKMEATIDQDVFYDDNVRLSENSEGSFGYMLTPVIYFSRHTENLQIGADASYGIQRYLDIDNLDQEVQRYGLQTNYTTERSSWGLNSGLSIVPIRNDAEEDSGDFATNAEKLTWSVSPSFSYQFTERDGLILSASHSDTSISSMDSSSGSLSDSTNQNINIAWQRRWTERYSSTLSVFYSRFESMPTSSVGTETTSNSYGVNFSTTFNFLENWEIEGTIGGRTTESESTVGMLVPLNPMDPMGAMGILTSKETNSSMGFLSDTAINYTGERLSGSIYWNRSLTPSSQGQLNDKNAVGLGLGYQLTQRLDANLGASYQITESASSDDAITRENINFRTSMSWQMLPDWTLVGAYRYRWQDSGASDQATVNSNSFTLSINYNWPGLSISR
ncbi:MAG: hypothetical protein HAW67_00395 [Endozoicomonadaceae bacterium]|nr:hypothetical protein [Endozoicomonadaceae bacterium]